MSDTKTCLKCGKELTGDEETYCEACMEADTKEEADKKATCKVVGHIPPATEPDGTTKDTEGDVAGVSEDEGPKPLMQLYMDDDGGLGMDIDPDRPIVPTRMIGIFHELIANLTLNLTVSRISRGIAKEIMEAMHNAKQIEDVTKQIDRKKE